MERLMVSVPACCAFAPHIVFRFDEVRQRWIMLAPERLMLPDEQAVEILSWSTARPASAPSSIRSPRATARRRAS